MPNEDRILANLNLDKIMVAHQMWKPSNSIRKSPIHFSHPTAGFIKLNFDGASKGNPGLARLGGIF